MNKLFLMILSLLTGFATLAQDQKGKISLSILNAQNTPVESATVELLRAKDSTLVKAALSDKMGLTEFEGIPFSQYIIRTTAVGFTTLYSASLTLSESNPQVNLPAQVLALRTQNDLQNVTVTAKKPFIQKLSDRIVVNVENSIVSAGSSVLDVLERSPGVTLDQNDVISLRGRAGVIIMIDGKPSPMSGADLANYLKGLPSNAVERIDIITNPSAKYDAAGNSGIIDIRMKKDQRLGINGSFTAGFGQGVYSKTNAGGTFNYRNKKMNVFGNYNYSYREMLNHLIINRNFYENGVFTGSDNKDNYAKMPFSTHSTRLGADFFPTSKTIIGFVVNGNFNQFQRDATIETQVNNKLEQPDFRFVSIGTNDDGFGNLVGNINIKHRFDSTGRELSADVDYGVFRSTSLTRTSSSFYNMNGTPKREDDILDGDQKGELILKTAKADYVNPFHGGKFELGFKTSYVSSDNDAKFYNVLGSGTVVDEGKTNRFFYEEYNNAGYANYNRQFKKWDFQVGLRGEQTDIKTRQVKGEKTFENHYFRLFPSAFFNYKLKEDQTVGVSVSRRIDRPSYSQLNPFLFMVDATIYSTGEPLLKPQMTWSYELNYTVKNMNFTLGYSHTTDPMNMVLSRILDVIPDFPIPAGQDSNITVQIPVNLSSSDYIGITATTPVRISKWWNMTNNFNLYYNHFNGNLGNVQLDNGSPAANIRTNNTFTLKKGWSAELNANLNTGARSGYAVFHSSWALSVGAQKLMMKGKGTLRLNVTDIFWTNLPNATVTYEGRYVENWHAYRDTRVANLSFTYRFGNNKVQSARRRTTASEEERQRAGGS